MIWGEWWVWMVGAAALGVLEIIVPGFFFLGFAIGAGITGGLIAVFGLIGGSLPMTALVFAVLSLVTWIILRRVFGVREGQVKVWDRDINDD